MDRSANRRDRSDVIFFSRGRGRGHAVNDLAIVAEMRTLEPSIKVQFVSYDVGAAVLRTAGEQVLDLDLPEINLFPETVVRATRALLNSNARLVVAHEELAAISAASIVEAPAYFLTHWFPDSRDECSNALARAEGVLFLEDPGLFEEPEIVAERVHYFGPLIRPLLRQPDDATITRRELGVLDDEFLVLVAPGSPTEAQVPIIEIVLPAFERLIGPKRLVWIAGRDHSLVLSATRGIPNVHVLSNIDYPERYMIACDVAVTKGTYNTCRELEFLGVPTISLSTGMNYIDDLYSTSFRNHRRLWVAETSPTVLALQITECRSIDRDPALDAGPLMTARNIAMFLLDRLDAIGHRS